MNYKLPVETIPAFEDMVLALRAMPKDVTSLDLSDHQFDFTTDQFREIFRLIPESVRSLNLKKTYLTMFQDQQLPAMFALIPATVTSLNLSGNELGFLNDGLLKESIAAIPVTVTSLDLSNNGFGDPVQEELVDAFAHIPANVVSLNLSENSFGGTPGYQLADVFGALPATVTSLDLSNNFFGCATEPREIDGGDLALSLAGIPASVTFLNLSANDFGSMPAHQLARAFAGISVGVISLDLSKNQLNTKSVAELAWLLGCFERIKTLALSLDEITTMTLEQRIAIRAMFPFVEPNNVVFLDDEGKEFSGIDAIPLLSSLGFSLGLQGSFFRAGIKSMKDEIPDDPVLRAPRSFEQ